MNVHLQAIEFDKAENEPRQVCCMTRAREPSFVIVSVPRGTDAQPEICRHTRAARLLAGRSLRHSRRPHGGTYHISYLQNLVPEKDLQKS